MRHRPYHQSKVNAYSTWRHPSVRVNQPARMVVASGALVCGLLAVLLTAPVRSKPVYQNEPTTDELKFMQRYGYLERSDDEMGYAYTAKSIAEAVQLLQAYAGLPPTGELDEETRSLFTKRRCGVRDIEDLSNRRRRYIVSQGWTKKDITYRVVNGSSTLAKPRIEELMASALAVWAPHGDLQFQRLDDGEADIMVMFAKEEHGDGFPFDGQGQVVAHAFPPPIGAMHFDDDELWADNPDQDDDDLTDFFAVVVHEIGHALGLSHSDVKESVMYPYYQVPVERLHDDDIRGMSVLYFQDSQPSTEAARAHVAPHSTKSDDDDDEGDVPDLCYTNYDTITVIQGKIFVFEEEWVWVLSAPKRVEEGPRRVHRVFRGLPERIATVKTVYEKRNGNVAIFSGRRYWEFDPSFQLVKRGNLSDYLIPSVVLELSTVFLSNYNNKTYLIEYERFWRFDEETNTMDPGYPKEMSAWRNLPYPVDSALVWEGDTYFFRGPRFWRFDNKHIEAHPYYPAAVAPVWLPCEYTSEMERYMANELP